MDDKTSADIALKDNKVRLNRTSRGEISQQRQQGKNIRRLLKIVAEAYLNPCESVSFLFYNYFEHILVRIPWDVEDYYKKHVKGGRDKKRIEFPNPHFGSHSKPLTLVDSQGRIVLWYLPDLLPSSLQVF